MTSVDTNILLYALNADATEHAAARDFLAQQQQDPDFVLCELVLLELYVLLRNPAVLRAPLGAAEAVEVIQRFRTHPTWQLIDHDPQIMDDLWRMAGERGFARTRIFDLRLAYTLRRHGVTRFVTRNVRHFDGLGFQTVFDPL